MLEKMIKEIIHFITGRTATKKRYIRGIGAYVNEANIYLYYAPLGNVTSYHVAKSGDGFVFEQQKKDLQIKTPANIHLKYATYHDFNITRDEKNHIFILLFKSKLGGDDDLFTARSKDLIYWQFDNHVGEVKEKGIIVPDYRYEGQLVMYYGEKNIHIAFSLNGHEWLTIGEPVLKGRKNSFDKGDMVVENVFFTTKGVLVIYHSIVKHGFFSNYLVGAALFDRQDPSKLLWRSEKPIWDSSKGWRGKKITPVGTVLLREKIISYWDVEKEGIYAVVYSFYNLHLPSKTKNVSLQLERAPQNPILAPKQENDWESFNTFNAATIFEGDTLHILYRAQGYDYISSLGYASSKNGVVIDERRDKPIFTSRHAIPKHIYPNDDPFASGGGYGGCEDPRLTKIDGRIYMTYVANDGWLPRLALTSISVENFLHERWLWEKPVLISPPGVIDKSGCILPEKINGKYVIFHRIFPDILIDFVDSLDFDGKTWLKGEYAIKVRSDKWDSRKIGAGAPPLKTKDGWLLIYYGVDDKDASKYKIGAMLLDLKDPRKVLHRTDAPILEPNTPLENEGFKPGIAYPCGAIIIGETLFVYYGGADSIVCVATANLKHFLSELKYSEIAKLDPAIIKKVL